MLIFVKRPKKGDSLDEIIKINPTSLNYKQYAAQATAEYQSFLFSHQVLSEGENTTIPVALTCDNRVANQWIRASVGRGN